VGLGHQGRKIAWVSRDIICKPKKDGDLSIKDLLIFNKALLGKWGWRLRKEEGGLWANIVKSKNGSWRSLVFGKHIRDESIWWRDLMLA